LILNKQPGKSPVIYLERIKTYEEICTNFISNKLARLTVSFQVFYYFTFLICNILVYILKIFSLARLVLFIVVLLLYRNFLFLYKILNRVTDLNFFL